MNDLIKELREWQYRYHYEPLTPAPMLMKQFDEILSRHEAEQGEGLREFEAWFSLFVARLYDNGHIKKDDPMFEAYKKFRAMMEKHPTPDKAEDIVGELKHLAMTITPDLYLRGKIEEIIRKYEEGK